MSKSFLRPLLFQVQPLILRRLCHEPPKQSIKLSNTERPPKDPPDEGYEPTSVDHDGIDVPDFLNPAAFRQFSSPDEQLGPGAGKAAEYKNGHYFAYHRFSFQELQTQAIELRDESRLDGGLQALIEADEESEGHEKQLGTMKKLEAECDEILAGQAKEKNLGVTKKPEEMSEEELQDWCLKKEAAAIENTLKKEKKLEDMTEKELDEWCLKKEAAIKEKEKPKEEKKGKDKLEEDECGQAKEIKAAKGLAKEKETAKNNKLDRKVKKVEKNLEGREKKPEEMPEEELQDWCLKKEAAAKEETAKKDKKLEDMTERELEEWCLKKEAAIKEKEKQKEEKNGKNKPAEVKKKEKPKAEIKGKEKPKTEVKGKEQPKEVAKPEKKLQDMSEEELSEWCIKKEADIKEIVQKDAEQTKKCDAGENKKE